MLDFLYISTRSKKNGVLEIYPKFIIKKSNDLMIRGGDFYAIWIEEKGLWSTDEHDALRLIDKELTNYVNENKSRYDTGVSVLYMWDAESGMIDKWHKYCQKQLRDNFHMLDDNITFSNSEVKKEDYASKKLLYPIMKGEIEGYERLISTLYSPEERHKIEWAIGSIVNGDSKSIQKFLVLYGSAGTGKSTILNIIQKLFEGYYSVFDAKALGSSSNSFALEAFKSNPLVAIQHDGDLSRIEDNTRLNSLVSHELMTVNEKFKSSYANRFKSFLFMGTNKPVKITDAKSGLIRRLIDVTPTGEKLSSKDYKDIMHKIDFELGAIAYHCQEVYESDKNYYDDYIPISMLGASNDFYNFILDSFFTFSEHKNVTLKSAWELYNTYCSEAKVSYPYNKRVFKEELKNYFEDYVDRYRLDDGTRVRSYYLRFKENIFEQNTNEWTEEVEDLIDFQCIPSFFDVLCMDSPAQYANDNGKPCEKWSNVKTKLKDIDTSKLHYVKGPSNHIFVDFDLKDESGNKSFELNLKAASKWPKTYAELSKSGEGIHLHYIYNGDIDKLSNIYDKDIEIKVFKGDSSLRRKLTKCNNEQIATITGGLPLKEDKKMINFEVTLNEKAIRTLIKKNLNKEYHPGTKPSIDFIYKILEDAYEKKMPYDVSDMKSAIISFGSQSTNQSLYCLKLINKMKFKSEDRSLNAESKKEIVFFDVEVFINLFIVCWKKLGSKETVRLINPISEQIEQLTKFNLVGFNCRRYDNHILYARLIGYNNKELYKLSQKIISGDKNSFFGEAYNLSYTDVYDFSSKKQSLKKFEIELGIHHQELGIPWDKPVPEELWEKVAGYCGNDVVATEAVFNNRKADFTARQILADLAGLSVNDTTNSLTTKIIFGDNKNPQNEFNYRDLGEPMEEKDKKYYVESDDGYSVWDREGRPHFPGYKYECGVSTYRDEEVGEGGYVYAEPGIYEKVALLDIASMHPSSIVAENLFGNRYTERFKEILDARIAIKHKEFDKARNMLNGVLSKYIMDENSASELAGALKIAINSVYGLTSAKFNNPFRDNRNKDNIVAKRGALFMINLKHEVQKRGYTVAHIKTDSIKIPNADNKIIDFVMSYGKEYGYNFEHEATYKKMCLVNDAVYIAKYDGGKHDGEWTATGAQFQVPYVFKKLFSKEDIDFSDVCETKSVTSSLYLDLNETLPEGEHDYHFVGKVGLFCPIKPKCGGGLLLREKDGKYYAATGSKGYRWLESEMIKGTSAEKNIDYSYYETMCEKAIETISKYGDFYKFIED